MSGASLWACFLLVTLLVSCADAEQLEDQGAELGQLEDAGELEDQAAELGGCLEQSATCSSSSSCCSGLCGPAVIGSAELACLEACAGTVCPPAHSCQGLEVGDGGYRAACVPLGAP